MQQPSRSQCCHWQATHTSTHETSCCSFFEHSNGKRPHCQQHLRTTTSHKGLGSGFSGHFCTAWQLSSSQAEMSPACITAATACTHLPQVVICQSLTLAPSPHPDKLPRPLHQPCIQQVLTKAIQSMVGIADQQYGSHIWLSHASCISSRCFCCCCSLGSCLAPLPPATVGFSCRSPCSVGSVGQQQLHELHAHICLAYALQNYNTDRM